jgi:hypothetical protein
VLLQIFIYLYDFMCHVIADVLNNKNVIRGSGECNCGSATKGEDLIILLQVYYLAPIIILYQIMAFVCGCLGLILAITCIASDYWLEADGFYQGLWRFCHRPNENADYSCSGTDKGIIFAALCSQLTNPLLIV